MIRIKQEKAWLRRFAADRGLDLVISDNRYGLAVPGVFCVFMTHQLQIRTPFGRWADLLLQRMNYRLIGKFSRCWVPDIDGADALAGELSNPVKKPHIPLRYIGRLSRMQPVAAGIRAVADGMQPVAAIEEIRLLVLLSGPEPQRSLLEKRILRQAAALSAASVSGGIVLVRGLPGGGKALKAVPASITVYDHLPAAALERLIAGARLVVARSGYSTVMDLARMRKNAVLVPTPGQTEQEYLGRYLAEKGWAICIRQQDLSLRDVLSQEGREPHWPGDEKEDRLSAEISSVLDQSRPSALG
ncbi:glycosyltransferase [Puia sp.]|uniref:glycosyltransferase n=1 Tax=Puia sp. TaxID=2045100 RepID=UPI002F423EA8